MFKNTFQTYQQQTKWTQETLIIRLFYKQFNFFKHNIFKINLREISLAEVKTNSQTHFSVVTLSFAKISNQLFTIFVQFVK